MRAVRGDREEGKVGGGGGGGECGLSKKTERD